MTLDGYKSPDRRFSRGLSCLILSLSVLMSPALSADEIDPQAQKTLQAMTDYLAGLSEFSAKADIGNEIVTLDGQKIQLNSSGMMTVKRPNQFYAARKSGSADVEFFFDGKVVTMQANHLQVYTQTKEPENIDQAITAISKKLNLEMPGADLIYSDAFDEMTVGLTNSRHLGMAYVNGVECHHLAFRKAHFDWQLWVQTGAKPLPMKYVITTKWISTAPQFSLQFRDWNTSPDINKKLFKFVASKKFKKLDKIVADEIGKLRVE